MRATAEELAAARAHVGGDLWDWLSEAFSATPRDLEAIQTLLDATAEPDSLAEALGEIAADREWGHPLRCSAPNVCDCAARLRNIARAALPPSHEPVAATADPPANPADPPSSSPEPA